MVVIRNVLGSGHVKFKAVTPSYLRVDISTRLIFPLDSEDVSGIEARPCYVFF